MPITRPMLADTWEPELHKLKYPVFTSPKLDGIRVLCHPELGPVTRKFKPLPNEYVRVTLSHPKFYGFDGELMLPNGNFNNVQSAFMSRAGEPNFVYHVFDCFLQPEKPWIERTRDILVNSDPSCAQWVEHYVCKNLDEVKRVESWALQQGYEGLMVRSPHGPYKSGRSTLREQWLLKLKRFKDAEGVVIGFVEQMHNANELEEDELGYAKRSSHKANLKQAGTLGKLVVHTRHWGEVNIGTGFTQEQRDTIWNNQLSYINRTLTFKYQEVLKDKPRFPVFLGWRSD